MSDVGTPPLLARLASALRRPLAAAYHQARRGVYRTLHPMRHRRARAVIARLRPRRIVVLCYGNICRSPFLEAALRQRLPGVAVSSAGLVGPGRQVPEHGLAVAASRGLDLRAHRSQVISHALLGSADLLIVMDERQARHVVRQYRYAAARVIVAGDLDPDVGDSRTIHDPWRQPLEVFEASYARLERCAVVVRESLAGPDRA